MLYRPDEMVALIRGFAVAKCTDFGEVHTLNLYEAFKIWVCETRSMKHYPGSVAFGEAMRAAGYEKHRKAGITYWVGIALKGAGEI